MWILFLNCVNCTQTGGESGDTADWRESSASPWVDDCGAFWPHDDVGLIRDFTYTTSDGWTYGEKRIEVVREDVWNGERAWVHHEEGSKDTGSALHRWEAERWYVCDIQGVWLVDGHTKYTTFRDQGRDRYEYDDVLETAAFVAPRQVTGDSLWYSTGVVIHIDSESGEEISRTVLEAEHVAVSTGNHRVGSGDYDSVQIQSGVPGTSDPDTRWLARGLGEIENENWELVWVR